MPPISERRRAQLSSLPIVLRTHNCRRTQSVAATALMKTSVDQTRNSANLFIRAIDAASSLNSTSVDNSQAIWLTKIFAQRIHVIPGDALDVSRYPDLLRGPDRATKQPVRTGQPRLTRPSGMSERSGK
jgi:hypothetical protein